MATMRLLAPADGNHGTLRLHGHTYTLSLGASLDVPDFAAKVMIANGWISPGAVQGSSATTARPTATPAGSPLPRNYAWTDTTVGAVIVWDGLTWRNPATGATV